MESAVPLYTSQGCGGDSSDSLPNHVFGWGRIDAKNALDSLTDTPATPTPTSTAMPPTATSTPTELDECAAHSNLNPAKQSRLSANFAGLAKQVKS